MCALYIDDFRCVFDNATEKKKISTQFDKTFSIKRSTGEYYLGMNMVYDRIKGTMTTTQKAYIETSR